MLARQLIHLSIINLSTGEKQISECMHRESISAFLAVSAPKLLAYQLQIILHILDTIRSLSAYEFFLILHSLESIDFYYFGPMFAFSLHFSFMLHCTQELI